MGMFVVMGIITRKEGETCFKEMQISRIRRNITAGSKWNRLWQYPSVTPHRTARWDLYWYANWECTITLLLFWLVIFNLVGERNIKRV